jgi:hypothetical protein
LFGIRFTQDKAIHFEDIEFITDHSNNLSLSPEGDDSGAVVGGMAHSRSQSLHAILEESPNEHDWASSEGESSFFHVPRACNVLISTIPITTAPMLEETKVPQTIPMMSQWRDTPTPLPTQLMAYQEE